MLAKGSYPLLMQHRQMSEEEKELFWGHILKWIQGFSFLSDAVKEVPVWRNNGMHDFLYFKVFYYTIFKCTAKLNIFTVTVHIATTSILLLTLYYTYFMTYLSIQPCLDQSIKLFIVSCNSKFSRHIFKKSLIFNSFLHFEIKFTPSEMQWSYVSNHWVLTNAYILVF